MYDMYCSRRQCAHTRPNFKDSSTTAVDQSARRPVLGKCKYIHAWSLDTGTSSGTVLSSFCMYVCIWYCWYSSIMHAMVLLVCTGIVSYHMYSSYSSTRYVLGREPKERTHGNKAVSTDAANQDWHYCCPLPSNDTHRKGTRKRLAGWLHRCYCCCSGTSSYHMICMCNP